MRKREVQDPLAAHEDKQKELILQALTQWEAFRLVIEIRATTLT